MKRARVLLVVAAILAAFWYGHNSGLQAVASDTHDALCALRADIAQRHQATLDYLADVKAGRRKPIAGISHADFKQSLDNQQHTLDALEPLRCD